MITAATDLHRSITTQHNRFVTPPQQIGWSGERDLRHAGPAAAGAGAAEDDRGVSLFGSSFESPLLLLPLPLPLPLSLPLPLPSLPLRGVESVPAPLLSDADAAAEGDAPGGAFQKFAYFEVAGDESGGGAEPTELGSNVGS